MKSAAGTWAWLLAALLGCGPASGARPPSERAEPSPEPSTSWVWALEGFTITSVAIDERRVLVGGGHSSVRVGARDVPSAGRADALVLALEADGTPLWAWRYGEWLDDRVLSMALAQDRLTVVLDSPGLTDLGGTVQRGNTLVGVLDVDGRPRGFTAFGSVIRHEDGRLGARIEPGVTGSVVWMEGHDLTMRGEPIAEDGPLAARMDDAGEVREIGALARGLGLGGEGWFVQYDDPQRLVAVDPFTDGPLGADLPLGSEAVDGAIVRRPRDGGVIAALVDRQHPRAAPTPSRLVRWSAEGALRWEREIPIDTSHCVYDVASDAVVVGGVFSAGEFEGLVPVATLAVVVAAFDATDGSTRWLRMYDASALYDIASTRDGLALVLDRYRAGVSGERVDGTVLVWLDNGVRDGSVEPGRVLAHASEEVPVWGLEGIEEALSVRTPLIARESDLDEQTSLPLLSEPTARERRVFDQAQQEAERLHAVDVTPLGFTLLPSPDGERAVILYAYPHFDSWRGELERGGRWPAMVRRSERAQRACLAAQDREREGIEQALDAATDPDELERLDNALEAVGELSWPDDMWLEGACDPMSLVYEGYAGARRCGFDRFVLATYRVEGSGDEARLGRRLDANEREVCSFIHRAERLARTGVADPERWPGRFATADIDGDGREEVLVESNLYTEVETSSREGLMGFPSRQLLFSVTSNGTVEELWSAPLDTYLDQVVGVPPPSGASSRAIRAWVEDIDDDGRLELIEEEITFRSRCSYEALRRHPRYGAVVESPGHEEAPWRFQALHCDAHHDEETTVRTCRVLGAPVRRVHEL